MKNVNSNLSLNVSLIRKYNKILIYVQIRDGKKI